MKAQGLSIESIVIIIIAIVVLAGVVVFFMIYNNRTKGLLGEQTGYSEKNMNCASLQSCVYEHNYKKCSDISDKCSNDIPTGNSKCVVYISGGNKCTCTEGSCS